MRESSKDQKKMNELKYFNISTNGGQVPRINVPKNKIMNQTHSEGMFSDRSLGLATSFTTKKNLIQNFKSKISKHHNKLPGNRQVSVDEK